MTRYSEGEIYNIEDELLKMGIDPHDKTYEIILKDNDPSNNYVNVEVIQKDMTKTPFNQASKAIGSIVIPVSSKNTTQANNNQVHVH